ncbi:sorting nexin-24 [Suricata suricatta]|uniref:sorting nexin-24 n=1 Tax=Suricata suricatta TaxID=37032 RepID=UPI0011555619|nr:sorting nexin-24 [Suricata suricatta]
MRHVKTLHSEAVLEKWRKKPERWSLRPADFEDRYHNTIPSFAASPDRDADLDSKANRKVSELHVFPPRGPAIRSGWCLGNRRRSAGASARRTGSARVRPGAGAWRGGAHTPFLQTHSPGWAACVSGPAAPSLPGRERLRGGLLLVSKFHEVFKIEVLMNGRKHFVEKRYSEFHALHKKLKKCIKTPEIPSKHVRNWVPKVLEQRRQGLETYLQAVILENEELPKLFLDFLNVRHLPSLPKAESCGSFDETESEESSKLSHQPVLLFLRDPFVLPAASDFPNVVIEGVLHGVFYPHLQPR